MTIDFSAGQHVRQLRSAGPRLNESLVRQILKDGDSAFAPLLELATSLELFDEEALTIFAPIHALRLLGEMPKVEMIEPLLGKYPVRVYGDWDELPRLWGTEVPQIIGRIGAAAVPLLWAVADSAEWPREARTMAVVALANLTVNAPETRDGIVASLTERLHATDDTMERTSMAIGLASLGVNELYNEIMALYREGKLEKTLLAPGTARQLLLTGGEKSLNCTTHTLQERYDQHGPKID